eukprot:Platyproteum_vivax@DN7609_c5_g1_i2.p1
MNLMIAFSSPELVCTCVNLIVQSNFTNLSDSGYVKIKCRSEGYRLTSKNPDMSLGRSTQFVESLDKPKSISRVGNTNEVGFSHVNIKDNAHIMAHLCLTSPLAKKKCQMLKLVRRASANRWHSSLLPRISVLDPTPHLFC